jgi:hypothetical protein
MADVLGWRGSIEDAPGSAPFWILPSSARPRAVIPVRPPGAAASMLRSFNDSMSQAARLRKELLGVAFRARLGSLLRVERRAFVVEAEGEHPGIEAHLAEVLGTPVIVGVFLGATLRPNAKPVLQVCSLEGELLAYAKVGWNDLTRRLIANEASALEHLSAADLRSIRVPTLMHHGAWADRAILLVSPGPRPLLRRGPRNGPLPAEAQLEVARSRWWETTSLPRSTFVEGLRERLTAGDDPGVVTRAEHHLDRIVDGAGDRPVTFGAWHGDWAPWNATRSSTGTFVWDWERYSGPVPLGFDASHLEVQVAFHARREPIDAAARSAVARLRRSRDLLGYSVDHAPTIVSLYLMERIARAIEGERAGVPVRRDLPSAILSALDGGLTA